MYFAPGWNELLCLQLRIHIFLYKYYCHLSFMVLHKNSISTQETLGFSYFGVWFFSWRCSLFWIWLVLSFNEHLLLMFLSVIRLLIFVVRVSAYWVTQINSASAKRNLGSVDPTVPGCTNSQAWFEPSYEVLHPDQWHETSHVWRKMWIPQYESTSNNHQTVD